MKKKEESNVEEQGSVLVRVYTSRAQIPVPDASVTLTRPTQDGRSDLIALRVTDESGLIQPISIPAPAAARSTHPGPEHPYATCDIQVEHPDFQMLRVENVQIFSGVETLQVAELIPLPEHPDPADMTSTVAVTPQPL